MDKDKPLLAVGAGTGITAKFAEQGGADLIVIYNSGRYRMSGFGSCAGLLAYGDANAIVMEMGEREVLPVVKETPVIAGVNGTDPTRRMSNFLKQVRDVGFDGVNNFPTVGVIDGTFRVTLEETGMGSTKRLKRSASRMRWIFSLSSMSSTQRSPKTWQRLVQTLLLRTWERR